MRRKLTFYLLTFALVWPAAVRSACAQVPAQQPQPGQQQQPGQPAAKQAKTAEEANLFNSILQENNPQKRLALLNEWKQKYPDTAFQEQRQTFYIQTYQQTGQLDKAVEAAKELPKLKPEDVTPQGIFTAHVTIASLTPFLAAVNPKLATDPAVWADGEKSANSLLQNVDQLLAPDKRPANMSEADWAKAAAQAKTSALTSAHQTLGWVAWQQKKYDVAEQELVKTLELTPNLPQVSYWLGSVVMAEKNPDKYPLAFFSFARAATYDGPGAPSSQFRQDVDKYLTKIYTTYHGDTSGLAELKQMAKTQPLPPPDLKIKSSAERQAEKEEELKKSNPKLATFLAIKNGLTGQGGQDANAFWNDMKGKAMPPLQGKVVSAKPAVKPKVVELDMTNSGSAEVTLAAAETPARCKLDPGTVVDFKDAEAKEFTPSPFMLKLEGGTITSGCSEAPAPVKKAAPKKSGAAKKKAG